MGATLTGNKATLANTLANQNNPMINTSTMQRYNPSYDPNSGSGVSGIMGTGGTPTSPINADATGINNAAKEGASTLLDGLAGKIGMNTDTPGMSVSPAPTPG